MDSVIEEIHRQRANELIRPDVWKRWQRHLVAVVQPQLDELDAMKQQPVPTPRADKGRV